MIEPWRALEILALCKAHGDYHALPSSAVDALLEVAKAHGYRKPKNANGSRARCFHAYLVRRAEVK